MAHEDRGHYAQKHPDAKQNPEIADKITAAAKDGTLDCASAHRIAKSLGIDPAQVGIQADLLELRIARCQMGLFGYGPGKKNLDPDVSVDGPLKDDIINTQKEGSLSCRHGWELAKAHKISKTEMGSACEKLEIKIKPCQLGAF
ncbi:MAG: hypothetical protein HUN04_26310 [Desulfobacter sp.]|nr:MAG: hypothetical protein HUN04_26310 [Desulfobacter sp.]